MSDLHQLPDGREVVRRRALLGPGRLVEAWPDLYGEGQVWVGAETRALLEEAAGPLAPSLTVDGDRIAIFYGPRVSDLGALPAEESLRGRVLSAHGIAVAWVTLDQFGTRVDYQPRSPLDPVFFLRRPGATVAHRWRLFRTRPEAVAFMREMYPHDMEAQAWAAALAVEDYGALLARHGRPEA